MRGGMSRDEKARGRSRKEKKEKKSGHVRRVGWTVSTRHVRLIEGFSDVTDRRERTVASARAFTCTLVGDRADLGGSFSPQYSTYRHSLLKPNTTILWNATRLSCSFMNKATYILPFLPVARATRFLRPLRRHAPR